MRKFCCYHFFPCLPLCGKRVNLFFLYFFSIMMLLFDDDDDDDGLYKNWKKILLLFLFFTSQWNQILYPHLPEFELFHRGFFCLFVCLFPHIQYTMFTYILHYEKKLIITFWLFFFIIINYLRVFECVLFDAKNNYE